MNESPAFNVRFWRVAEAIAVVAVAFVAGLVTGHQLWHPMWSAP